MLPLRFCSWQSSVGLCLGLIALLYAIDVLLVPLELNSLHLLLPSYSRSSPTAAYVECGKDHLKSGDNHDSPTGDDRLESVISAENSNKSGNRFSLDNDLPGSSSQREIAVTESDVDPDRAIDWDESWRSMQAGHKGRDSAVGSLQEPVPETSFVYRNATWKPEIGLWLARCAEAAAPDLVPEQFSDRACLNKCGGHGVCNYELGECRCFHGYTGTACELEQQYLCNTNETTSWVSRYGTWRVSICSSTCDTRTGFCYCGQSTKYPGRQVAEACGFNHTGGQVNWQVPDPLIFSNRREDPGWCNVDPEELYAGKAQRKSQCYCTYDGRWGELCEIPVESFCINQCSGNGECHGGFCACVEGWHGIDCSIPSPLSSLKKWPNWLVPAVLRITADVPKSWEQQTLEVIVERPRPLIYVYDLPPRFNSLLLQGRHFKSNCVNRLYDAQNTTLWVDYLYGAETALLESLLSSTHRTANAEEADFFYVPVFGACAIGRADEDPTMDMQTDHLGLRGYFSGDYYKHAYEYIKDMYPYWNQSGGRDHIWLFPWDEGACSAPKEIWNSMMLVHWGNTNSIHNYSTTGYAADNWDEIPTEWRGNHPCYDPEKDLVLPAWKVPSENLIKERLWARPREQRRTLFYFNGNLGSAYEYGRPEAKYSMGLRQKLGAEFGSEPNNEGKLGRQVTPNVIVTSVRSEQYALELSQSRFCGVLPGDGWSGRMEDSILHGCIPVIIQDGIHLPFENVLDYNKFSVRIPESDLPHMVKILQSYNESEVDSMLAAVQGLWQRFTYHNSIKLETQRLRLQNKLETEWAEQYDTLSGDDAFSTLLQVLHYKRSSWSTAADIDREGSRSRNYCKKGPS